MITNNESDYSLWYLEESEAAKKLKMKKTEWYGQYRNKNKTKKDGTGNIVRTIPLTIWLCFSLSLTCSSSLSKASFFCKAIISDSRIFTCWRRIKDVSGPSSYIYIFKAEDILEA